MGIQVVQKHGAAALPAFAEAVLNDDLHGIVPVIEAKDNLRPIGPDSCLTGDGALLGDGGQQDNTSTDAQGDVAAVLTAGAAAASASTATAAAGVGAAAGNCVFTDGFGADKAGDVPGSRNPNGQFGY